MNGSAVGAMSASADPLPYSSLANGENLGLESPVKGHHVRNKSSNNLTAVNNTARRRHVRNSSTGSDLAVSINDIFTPGALNRLHAEQPMVRSRYGVCLDIL